MSLSTIKARIVKCRNGNVASAITDEGVALCYVFYIRIGDVFLITGVSVNPIASPKDAQLTGDLIDALLEQQASSAGISSLLMMVPGQDQCEEVRTYTRTIPQSAAMQGVGRYDNTPATHFLN
jgi:hypothetical protein